MTIFGLYITDVVRTEATAIKVRLLTITTSIIHPGTVTTAVAGLLMTEMVTWLILSRIIIILRMDPGQPKTMVVKMLVTLITELKVAIMEVPHSLIMM